MATISSVTDLRTWIHNRRPDVTGGDVARLVAAIQDDDHPAWGTDWTDYLTSYDYESALG